MNNFFCASQERSVALNAWGESRVFCVLEANGSILSLIDPIRAHLSPILSQIEDELNVFFSLPGYVKQLPDLQL